jgi:CBS domain-containing protein
MNPDSPSSNATTSETEGDGQDMAPVVSAEATEAAAAEAAGSPPEEPAEPAPPADLAGVKPPEESPPAAPVASAPVITEVDGRGEESDLVELEPELVRPPLPPSLRPSVAKDATSEPLGITANLPPPSWPPKVVADLMTRKIITVRQGDPIGELDVCMQRFRFRHLPVVAEGMKLVGLITRTDLLHAKLGTRPDGTAVPSVDASTPAEAIMRMNVVVARLDSPLSTACRAMLKNQLSCLPVALEDGTLVGILTMTDFLKLVLAVFPSEGRQPS